MASPRGPVREATRPGRSIPERLSRRLAQPGWPRRFALAAVFATAVVVLAEGAGVPVFWVDEYLTQVAIAESWPDLVQRIVHTDPGPGPYYVIMKVWSALSSTPGWMRVPSVLATAGAVVLFVVLVRRLTDTTTAALAAAVLLLLPNVSRYAQENRPYAFALLFTVLAVTLWQISLQPDRSGNLRSRWWSVGFGAAVAAMGLAHLYTLALLPALAIAAVAAPATSELRRRLLLRTIVPAGAALLAISPHIWLNLAHPTGSPTDPPLSGGSLANVVRLAMPTVLAAALGVVALLGSAIGLHRARLRPATILAAAWVVVPVTVLLLAKATTDLPVTRVRYLLFVMPGVAVLVAIGLRHLARLSPPIAVILVAALALLGLPRHIDIRQIDGHHADQALDPLLHRARELDLPVVTANTQAIRLVNAATYPQTLLSTTKPDTTARRVAVVERSDYRHTVRRDFGYYRPDRWRPIIRCRLSLSMVTIVENIRSPIRPLAAAGLAEDLTEATANRAPCTVIRGH